MARVLLKARLVLRPCGGPAGKAGRGGAAELTKDPPKARKMTNLSAVDSPLPAMAVSTSASAASPEHNHHAADNHRRAWAKQSSIGDPARLWARLWEEAPVDMGRWERAD